jgi:hypothetical protein
MLIVWGVLIRCNYLGWAPLQVVLTELTNGGSKYIGTKKLAGLICMRLKG